jgi:hypothetical protein
VPIPYLVSCLTNRVTYSFYASQITTNLNKIKYILNNLNLHLYGESSRCDPHRLFCSPTMFLSREVEPGGCYNSASMVTMLKYIIQIKIYLVDALVSTARILFDNASVHHFFMLRRRFAIINLKIISCHKTIELDHSSYLIGIESSCF